MEHDDALRWIHEFDGLFPINYLDVSIDEVLDRIGMGWDKFHGILEQFTNWELFDGVDNLRPLLKC